ncbi:hypothetical protein EYF80_043979 [Liparis tanakae]|uniref:Uncharacterized protein n=1 Tax=Liparis tanakae TaxID=230148 RepID=A0A4Z2FZ33_9TELE|nr:hypothetical protein EYF80_043979 [Liparis tanakae]
MTAVANIRLSVWLGQGMREHERTRNGMRRSSPLCSALAVTRPLERTWGKGNALKRYSRWILVLNTYLPETLGLGSASPLTDANRPVVELLSTPPRRGRRRSKLRECHSYDVNDFRSQHHESSSSQLDPTAEQLSADWLSQRSVLVLCCDVFTFTCQCSSSEGTREKEVMQPQRHVLPHRRTPDIGTVRETLFTAGKQANGEIQKLFKSRRNVKCEFLEDMGQADTEALLTRKDPVTRQPELAAEGTPTTASPTMSLPSSLSVDGDAWPYLSAPGNQDRSTARGVFFCLEGKNQSMRSILHLYLQHGSARLGCQATSVVV